MSQLESAHAPGLRLPGIFAGHRIDGATTADLIYTLGLLVDAGTDRVSDVECAALAQDLISGLNPAEVEGFAAYRVSETAARLIRAHTGTWSDAELAHARAVGDSAGVVDSALKGELPTNWIAVAARCLAGVAALGGVTPQAAQVNRLLARVFGDAVAAPDARGWLDDSGGWGDSYAAYDIYTPDTYLFAQPLAAELGEVWGTGLRNVLADLDDIAQPGGAVVWGRSVGALALAITVELAGVATSHGLSDRPDRWLARAEESFATLQGWFDDGVIAAHQARQPMFYRGPARRLQMTLDIYGKLLLAAAELKTSPNTAYSNSLDTWGPADRLIEFDAARRAAAWTNRSRSLPFVMPMMASWSSDYAPSPRSPGLFETPTSGHPVMLPVLSVGDDALLPSGLPVSIDHSPSRLLLEHRGWAPAGAAAEDDKWLDGTRRATYRVEGRTLRVGEELEFAEVPHDSVLSVSIPALADRPLDVAVEFADAHYQRVETRGIAEWRSFWSELTTVHQIEIPLDNRLRFSWSVTPQLRVASTICGHQYDKSLYDPLRERLVELPAPPVDDDLTRRLRAFDIFHVGWPEWWSGVEPAQTEAVLEQVKASGVKIVWTQHNLLPHFFKTAEAASSYQLWAEAVDAVIHHTEWGREVALNTYDYGAGTTHVVIPHGHWGHQYPDRTESDRSSIERELGWPDADIRLAVVGAPRLEKDLQLVIDAFARVDRPDIHLLIRTQGDESIPDDPRITVDHRHTPESLYHRRMHAIDGLIMPFAPSGMMTTGTAFDAIGSSTAAITSQWAFFDETFAGADIRYGASVDDLEACLDGLTRLDLERSGAAIGALQPRYEWEAIANMTLDLFESLYAE